MSITASNYDRMRAAAEDLEVDLSDEERTELKTALSQYEQSRQTAGLPQYGMQTSAEAIEKVEKEYPRPKPQAKAARVPVAEEEDEDPETAFLRETQSEFETTRQQSNELDEDPTLASASKRKGLFAPPEFMPEDAGFLDLLQAQPFVEPPLDVAKAALKREDLTEGDPEYREFADAMWQEWYTKAQQEGRPAYRSAYMNSPEWKAQAKRGTAAQMAASTIGAFGTASEYAGAAAGGANKAFAGYPSEALDAIERNPLVALLPGGIPALIGKEVGQRHIQGRGPSEGTLSGALSASEQAHPGVAIGGQVAGSLSPASVGSRVFGGATNLASRALPSIAGRGLAPALGRAAAAIPAGALAGATESAATDVVQGTPAAAIPGRAAMSAALGAAGGPVGELIGSAAGALVRRNRGGALGPEFAAAEKAGMTSGPLAKSKALVDVERQARGRHIEDVLSEPVTRKVGQERLKAQQAVIKRTAAENASMEGELHLEPMEELRSQVWKEYDRMVDNPHASEAAKNELLTLLENLSDPKELRAMQQHSGLQGREFQKAFADQFLDTSIEVGPRKLFADDFNRMVRSLSETASRADISEPDAWKRILGAAMKARDKYPGYRRIVETEKGAVAIPEPAMGKGEVLAPRGSMSATKMRHDVELGSQTAQNEALGLPATLKARVEPGHATGLPEPELTPAQAQALNGVVQNYKKAANHEAQTAALEEAARVGGFQDELDLIAGSRAYSKLKKAGSFTTALSTRGTAGLFTSAPLKALSVKGDPLFRALSRQAPGFAADLPPLSAGLRDFLRRVSGKGSQRGSIDPLREMQTAGRGSARRLAPVAAGGERQKAQLSPQELALLARMIEASRERELEAGGM